MGDNDVFIRVDYVSVDPGMRGWISSSTTYIEPVKIGGVMYAGGIGTVLAIGKGVHDIKIGDAIDATPVWASPGSSPSFETDI